MEAVFWTDLTNQQIFSASRLVIVARRLVDPHLFRQRRRLWQLTDKALWILLESLSQRDGWQSAPEPHRMSQLIAPLPDFVLLC